MTDQDHAPDLAATQRIDAVPPPIPAPAEPADTVAYPDATTETIAPSTVGRDPVVDAASLSAGSLRLAEPSTAGPDTADESAAEAGGADRNGAGLLAGARDRVAPAVATVRERVAPAVATATAKVAPAVSTAKEKAAPTVATVKEKVAPAVAPHVRAARDRVATTAGEHPWVATAAERTVASSGKSAQVVGQEIRRHPAATAAAAVTVAVLLGVRRHRRRGHQD